jgi:LPS sulfotransferase NodH
MLLDTFNQNRLVKRRITAKAYLNYLGEPSADRRMKLMIFGQGRTGSTLLENLLTSTRHFEEHGELLNPRRYGKAMFPIAFLEGMAAWERSPHFICHVKIYQLTEQMKYSMDPGGFLRALLSTGWRFIYLRRENVVRHVLSNVIAVHRDGQHFKYDDEPEDLRMAIEDCDAFARSVEGRLQRGEAEREALEGIEYAEVGYEADLERPESHQPTVDRLLDGVGLERRRATTVFHRINTFALPDLIVNYDAFAEALKRHGFEQYLE